MALAGWLAQPAVLPWIALGFGLCIGSFLNVVIYRLPKMMEREWRAECASLAGQAAPAEPPLNLLAPRSRCPSCGHVIRASENIPVLSWLVLRGKCAHCGVRISARYPLVEVLGGLGEAFSFWHFGASLAALGATVFVWFTIALAFI